MEIDGGIEQQLRTGMRRTTATVVVPDDLWARVEGRIRHRARSRRMARTAVAAVLVVVLGMAVVLVRSAGSPGEGGATDELVPALPGGTWPVLPEAPIGPRTNYDAIWTGREMVVLGGIRPGLDDAPADDGAAYDPATGDWREIAPPPEDVRGAPISVWTGREVVALGGAAPSQRTTGAAYDPATDTWRTIAGANFGQVSSTGSYAVWTGDKVLVAGFFEPARSINSDGTHGAALYDPATDTWTALADAPEPLPMFGDAFWTGTELIVVGRSHATDLEPATHIVALGLNPATGEWRQLPVPPLGSRPGMLAAWTGNELVIGGGGMLVGQGSQPTFTDAAAYDPATDSWRTLPDAPVAFAGAEKSRDVVVGQSVVALITADPARRPVLLDMATETWQAGPEGFAGSDFTAPEGPYLSTGASVLVWSGGAPADPPVSPPTPLTEP